MFGSDYSCCAREHSNRASTAFPVGKVLGMDGLKYGCVSMIEVDPEA